MTRTRRKAETQEDGQLITEDVTGGALCQGMMEEPSEIIVDECRSAH